MRRSGFRVCLIVAAAWVAALVIYSATKGGADACSRDCLMANDGPADLTYGQTGKGPTIVPTRWARQRW